MIVKSCSSDRQDDVSVIDRGDGFSEVWLRRNHAQDAADNGPEGPATTFWTWRTACSSRRPRAGCVRR